MLKGIVLHFINGNVLHCWKYIMLPYITLTGAGDGVNPQKVQQKYGSGAVTGSRLRSKGKIIIVNFFFN